MLLLKEHRVLLVELLVLLQELGVLVFLDAKFLGYFRLNRLGWLLLDFRRVDAVILGP